MILTAAALCGFCAYALYMGVLENLLLLPVLFWIRGVSSSQLPGDLGNVKELLLGHTVHTLYRERKARYCATDARVRELQSRMDTYYAWLIFLYCFSLLALVGSAVLGYYSINPPAHRYAQAAALLLWFVAFRTDVFTTRVELWKVTHHRQW